MASDIHAAKLITLIGRRRHRNVQETFLSRHSAACD